MKTFKLIVFLLFIIIYQNVYGQKNKIEIFAEVGYPRYIINQEIGSQYLGKSKFNDDIRITGSTLEKYLVVGFNYPLTNKLDFQFNFHWNEYWNGINLLVSLDPPISVGRQSNQEGGFHFEFGGQYDLFKIGKVMNFQVGLNYVYMLGRYSTGRLLDGNKFQTFGESDIHHQAEYKEIVGETYGFRKHYHFLKPFITLNFHVYHRISLYSTLGYQKGFTQMSAIPGRYRYFTKEFPNGSEWIPFLNSSKGSMFNIGFGVKYDFGREKREKKTVD